MCFLNNAFIYSLTVPYLYNLSCPIFLPLLLLPPCGNFFYCVYACAAFVVGMRMTVMMVMVLLLLVGHYGEHTCSDSRSAQRAFIKGLQNNQIGVAVQPSLSLLKPQGREKDFYFRHRENGVRKTSHFLVVTQLEEAGVTAEPSQWRGGLAVLCFLCTAAFVSRLLRFSITWSQLTI